MKLKMSIISAVLIAVLVLSGCFANHEDADRLNGDVADNTTDNQMTSGQSGKNMLDTYVSYLGENGIHPTANPDEFDENVEYDAEALFYHINDFDHDGTPELACSDATIDGNGVYILTVKNGEVVPFAETYMPYSKSEKTCSLAEINGVYGLLYANVGETREFDFTDFKGESILSGSIQYNDGEAECVLDGEICDEAAWHDAHGAIEYALFFEISECLPW